MKAPHTTHILLLFCLMVLVSTGFSQTAPLSTTKAHYAKVNALAFSSDGKLLLSGGEDGLVKIWSYPDLQLVREFEQHDKTVQGVAFSHDNTKIASGSTNETANIWNARTGEHLFTFGVTKSDGSLQIGSVDNAMYDVAFAANDSRVLACGGNVLGRRSQITIYDATTGGLIKANNLHAALILAMDIHPDGKRIASSSASTSGDGSVILSSLGTGDVIRTYASNFGDVYDVKISPDGKYVAATADRNVFVWETETGKKVQTFTGHFDRIFSIAFSPDGKFILSGSEDKNINVWSMEKGELLTTINNPQPVNAAMFSVDGKSIVAGLRNGSITSWTFDPLVVKNTEKSIGVSGLEIMPRVRKSSTAPFANLKEIPELVIETGVHNDLVQNIRYTKDGKEIVTASWDKTIRIWEASNGRLIRTIRVPQYTGIEGQIYAMDVSADKKYIAVAGSSIGQKYDKKSDKYIGDYVLLIDYKSGKILDLTKDHQQSVFAVAFSPDGKRLASCAGQLDNKVNIYNLDGVQNKLTLHDSFSMTSVAQEYFPGCETIFDNMCNHTVLGVKFGVDSKDVFAIDAHGMLIRYTPKNGSTPGLYKLVGESAGRKNAAITGKLTDRAVFRSMAMDPKGRYVACGDLYGKVLLFDAKGKDPAVKGETSEILVATIPTQKKDAVMSVDFDPTGTMLAVAVEGEVRVYEIKPDLVAPASITTPLAIFKDHRKSLTTAAFSSDGTSVVSSGGDKNTVLVWDAKTGKQKFVLGGGRQNNKVTRVGTISTSPFLIGFGTEMAQRQSINNHGKISKAFDLKNLRVIETAYDSLFSTAESMSRESSVRMPEFKSWFNESMVSYMPLKTGATIISTESALFIDNATNLLTITGARSYGMASSPDGETFYIGQSDGRIQIYDTKTMTLIATLYVSDNNEWILFTPDGYYTSSRHGAKLVGWLVNENIQTAPKFYPFEQFDLRLNRPDIVLSRIGGLPKKRIELLYKAYQKRLEKMGVDEKLLSDNLVAPSIQVDVPVAETTQKNLTFTVKASDTQNNLDRLNIYVNDVPLYGSKGFSLKQNASRTLDKQILLELTSGQNKIQVSVLNSAGIESLQETRYVSYRGATVVPNLFIVAIGVSSYDNIAFNLQYAAKDAKDISALYQSQVGKFGTVKAMQILDKEATVETIKAAKIFLKEARPEDEVILFAAGHGLLDDKLDFYFATADVDFEHPSVRGLKYDDLEELLDQIGSRKKLMLIDACHSGEIDKDAVVVSDQPIKPSADANAVKSRGFKNLTNNDLGVTDVYELMRMMFADLRKGSGAMVISSASGVEFAFENDVWKNGVFTYSLLEGLKTGNANLNKDTDVQVSELRDYVIKRVGELTNGKQTPTSRKENLEFDFKVW